MIGDLIYFIVYMGILFGYLLIVYAILVGSRIIIWLLTGFDYIEWLYKKNLEQLKK